MDGELGDIVAGRRHVDPSFFCRKIRLLGRGRLGGTYSYGPSRESCDERVKDIRGCLLLVGAAGVTMSAQQDGHGLGILFGAGIASLILLRRRALTARSIHQR